MHHFVLQVNVMRMCSFCSAEFFFQCSSDWIQQSAGGSSEQQDIRQFVQKIVKQLRISQQRLADDLTRLGAHASQGALSSFKNYKMASNAETRITKYIIMWLKSQAEYLTADERTRLAELEVWSTAQFDALASSKRSIYEVHHIQFWFEI